MATDPLDVLSDDELLLVLDYLLPHELGACEVACRRVWKLSSGDMHAKYWTRQCGEVFGVGAHETIKLTEKIVDCKIGSSREAYHQLSRWGGRYAGGHTRATSLIGRAMRAFDMISEHHPMREVCDTLNLAWTRGGAALNEHLDELETRLTSAADTSVKLPEALRAVLLVCNGQSLEVAPTWNHDCHGYGCLGGYIVDDIWINTRLLSIQHINDYARSTLNPAFRGEKLPIHVAASIGNNRQFDVDCVTGRLYMKGFELVPATPQHPRDTASDDVLCWLEEFGKRLASGYYHSAGSVVYGHTPHFRIFPCVAESPQYTEVTIRSLRVSISAVLHNFWGTGTSAWVYSVDISLLTGEDQAALPAADRLKMVQLQRVSFEVQGHDESIEQVADDEGVHGERPILSRRDDADSAADEHDDFFVYQSLVRVKYGGADARTPSLRGRLRFIEGTLDHPTGPAFDVVCGEISLGYANTFIF